MNVLKYWLQFCVCFVGSGDNWCCLVLLVFGLCMKIFLCCLGRLIYSCLVFFWLNVMLVLVLLILNQSWLWCLVEIWLIVNDVSVFVLVLNIVVVMFLFLIVCFVLFVVGVLKFWEVVVLCLVIIVVNVVFILVKYLLLIYLIRLYQCDLMLVNMCDVLFSVGLICQLLLVGFSSQFCRQLLWIRCSGFRLFCVMCVCVLWIIGWQWQMKGMVVINLVEVVSVVSVCVWFSVVVNGFLQIMCLLVFSVVCVIVWCRWLGVQMCMICIWGLVMMFLIL